MFTILATAKIRRLIPLLLVPILSVPAFPQQPTPSKVHGCLRDTSGGVVPDASITLTVLTTGRRQFSRSNTRGCFELDAPADSYRLEIRAEGFSPREAVYGPADQDLGTFELQIASLSSTLVVTSTRFPLEAGSTGSSVDTVSRADIDAAQNTSVADALRTVGGSLQVVRTGSTGGLTTLFTRGGESDYTKILLDGVPLNLPGGTYDLSHLPTDNVERIEIVRGPHSAQFGSDSVTGVVQIFTRQGSRDHQVDYGVEGGSFATLRQRAGLRGGKGVFDYSSTFSRTDTDNVGRNSDYRNFTYLGNLGVSLANNHSVRATLLRTSTHLGTPGPTAPGYTSFGPNDRSARREYGGGLTYRFQVAAVGQHLAYRIYDIDQNFTSDFGTSLIKARRHRGEYRGDVALPVSTGRFTSGLFSYGVDVDREESLVAAVRRQRNNLGYYVHHQSELYGVLSLSAGARIEDNETFGTSVNPKLALAYRVGRGLGVDALNDTTVRLSAGTGIKEPSFIENFSENRFFLGNATLEAERSRSWEVGLHQSLLRGALTADATWYSNRIRNLIELVRAPDGSSRYDNIGRTMSEGLETRVRLRAGRFRVHTSYTLLHGRIQQSRQTAYPFRTGDPLLRRPRHAGDLSVVWAGERFQGSWSSIWVGTRADSDFFTFSRPQRSNSGYSVSNLAVGVRVHALASVRLRFENVFDRAYQEVLGFPALGRAIIVGTEFHWGGGR